MAEIYKGKSHGSRTGAEIIGEGRHPRREKETPVQVHRAVEKPPVKKTGTALKRGDYNG